MLKDFDLNALQILSSVIKCRSVTEAANLLEISPSSVTYAINKIRKATDNPLFSRSKNGIVPTTMALELNNRYIKAMELIKDGMAFSSDQTSTEIEQNITLSTYTFLELWFSCIALKEESMNHICLNFISNKYDDKERILRIRKHHIDIDIGSALPYDPSIISTKLFSSNYQVLVSKNHSTIKDTFTMDDWNKSKYIRWMKSHEEIYNHIGNAGNIDEIKNIDFHVTSDSSLNSLFLCAMSDFLLLIPGYMAEFYMEILPVRTFDLPFENDLRSECYAHHHRSEKNNARIATCLKLLKKMHSECDDAEHSRKQLIT